MKGYYDKSTKLDFGMYKGYELGIVYLFDPKYLDWCLTQLDNFCITDIDELLQYGVINPNLPIEYRRIGVPEIIPNIDMFESFQELIESCDLSHLQKFEFSSEAIKRNTIKSNNYKLWLKMYNSKFK